MLVTREQLNKYNIASDLFFSRRTGSGDPISRDQFFIDNPLRLTPALYCAIGNDTLGWTLEKFNSLNWTEVLPNSNYTLISTTEGLKALSSVIKGNIQLEFSGIKIIDAIVTNPSVPIRSWVDADLIRMGNVVFSIGTLGSPNSYDSTGANLLSNVLSWRFNGARTGLQYILNLPPEGLGAISDDNQENWKIGTIGLYVKDPDDGNTDILFAVATLPAIIEKFSSDVERVGNTVRLYFNLLLDNLGTVSNLTVMSEGEQNLPEVPNESLLLYPNDPEKRPYNCYVVDNLYGTGMPAIALKRTSSAVLNNNTWTFDEEGKLIGNWSTQDWSFLQPTDNMISVDPSQFDSTVNNYMFVYWNATSLKYELAEGKINEDAPGNNEKLPIGIRIGNSVVFSGEIINAYTNYVYQVNLENAGTGYTLNDELLLMPTTELTIKIRVTNVDVNGAILAFVNLGPTVGNMKLPTSEVLVSAIYDPRSQLPRKGSSGKFTVVETVQDTYKWDFPESWLNKPLYCDHSLSDNPNEPNAGRPTNIPSDGFLGWCTGTNSMRLALDLRNEASFTTYGTTRYATNEEVKESLTHINSSEQTALNPKTVKDNYLQTSLPSNLNQTGSRLGNPINVESYVRFDKVVLGKDTRIPYDNTGTNPYVTDSDISFYGTSFRAWYADLAEFYEADSIYPPGTLITFGKGTKEISIANIECNGIISTKPGYQLGDKKTELHLPVALTGRVPVLFDGRCMPKFGDKIYLSKFKPGFASTVENGKALGKVISKKITTSNSIECVVRIEF